ncbi:type II secretion system F family protein [Gottfriedia acidiceleris]|uniref:type II secretion system F family protein n=1 Tax=Gottfriedia acidiceleris TaxID=371036 RepID=UPI00101C9D0A|nr:type II secretion system F family protein [Gottfriedia acidiceleris]
MLQFIIFLLTAVCFTLLTAGVMFLFSLYQRKTTFNQRVHTYLGERNSTKNKLDMGRSGRTIKTNTLLKVFWEKGVQQVSNRASKTNLKKLDVMLRDAGLSFKLSAIEFRLIQILLSAGGGVLIFILFLPIANNKSMLWIMAIAVAMIGYRYPIFYLGKKKTQRVKEINKNMADFFDMVNLLIEAGMGLDAAISVVCQKMKGPITEEFKQTLEDMKLGKSRREAFYDLRKRVPSDTFQSIITSLIQADQLGIGMAKVLRNMTTRIREQRREAAREQAMKAPIKMLFPMIFFIFPSLFIVILGPVVIQIITKSLFGG